ncbi:MAG: hypothetical protein AB1540_12425 [Bdellovibrionota bacterium]
MKFISLFFVSISFVCSAFAREGKPLKYAELGPECIIDASLVQTQDGMHVNRFGFLIRTWQEIQGRTRVEFDGSGEIRTTESLRVKLVRNDGGYILLPIALITEGWGVTLGGYTSVRVQAITFGVQSHQIPSCIEARSVFEAFKGVDLSAAVQLLGHVNVELAHYRNDNFYLAFGPAAGGGAVGFYMGATIDELWVFPQNPCNFDRVETLKNFFNVSNSCFFERLGLDFTARCFSSES